MTLPFSQYPQLMQVGGSVVVTSSTYSDPNCQQGDIIVVQASAGQYLAFSASCPHSCCDVEFTGTGFHCPCHDALFDLTGKSAGIRTNLPLPALKVCVDATAIYVSW